LAVQLLGQNVDDGAEGLVDLAYSAWQEAESSARPALSAFLTEVTGQVGLAPALVEVIVAAALHTVRAVPLHVRNRYRVLSVEVRRTRTVDLPLWTLLSGSLDGNLPAIRAAIRAGITEKDLAALFVVDWSVVGANWPDPARERELRDLTADLRRDHPTVFQTVLDLPPLAVDGPTTPNDELDRILRCCGPAAFYRSHQFLGMGIAPVAVTLLAHHGQSRGAVVAQARRLCAGLLFSPTPWIPGGWWADWRSTGTDEDPWEIEPLRTTVWPNRGEDLATFLVLSLPYAETAADDVEVLAYAISLPTWAAYLAACRRAREVPLDWPDLPEPADTFLRRWVRREISVIAAPS
jgi:hypothetical protein